jgi:hypothetical protein
MNAARVVAAVAFGAACSGCAFARIAGGAQVAPGTEPVGNTVALFRVARCEDANGERIPEPEARVTVVRLDDKRLVLVERHVGYDSLVVDNGWDEGNARVFQLAIKGAADGPYLREYRTPLQDARAGRFVIVKRVENWGDSRRGFHAVYTTAALTCDLMPVT